MPASQAPNETRLPRAVLRRSAAIAARYAPQGESGEPSPSAAAAPANQPAAAPDTTADPQQAAPATDPRHSDPNYWKQRFEVTSGILARERTDRQQQFGKMNQRITELESQSRSSPTADASAEIDLKALYTPEQIEAYGEEQCRVMAETAMKAAKKEAQALIDAAVRPLQEERTRKAENDAATVQRQFTDRLTELVPNWRDIDKDPRWVDDATGWLAQEDENGVVRQQLLDIHIAKGDAAKVARMFKTFEKSVAVPTPPITPSGSGASPGSGDAAPPAAGDVSALTAPTGQEVKDFYKRSALGKVKDDERVRFEARMKLRNPVSA